MLSDLPRHNVEPSIPTQENQTDSSTALQKNIDTDVTASEETPLLRTSSPPSAGEVLVESGPRTARWIAIMILLLVLLQAGDQLMQTPLTRVFESIYCYGYWEEHDPSNLLAGRADAGPGALGGVEEALCKLPEIQSQVAALLGNLNFFNGIPSLVLAVPCGMLADKWGRKPICLMGLVSFPCAATWICLVCKLYLNTERRREKAMPGVEGFTPIGKTWQACIRDYADPGTGWFWQAFDVRLIWLSALHGICGGSSPVISAIFMTIISDIVPEESRASVFFSVSASGLAMNFLVPPLAAALMEINPWIPIFGGILFETIPIMLMILVPETLRHEKASVVEVQPQTAQGPRGPAWIEPIHEIRNMIREDWRVTGLTTTFLLHVYTLSSATLLMLQYVSTRYSISFAQATFLVSLRSGFTMAIFLALMPWLSHILISRWGYSAKKKDLALARVSAIVASVGWLLVGIAPNMPFFVVAIFVCTLGAGLFTFVRSFLTSIVSTDHVAKLFTFMSVLDTIGLMGAGPVFAWLFKVGLGIGGAGLGLPFLILGVFYAAFSGLMFCVRIKQDDRGEEREEEFSEPSITAT